jgi:hypothetical protein
MRRRVVRGDTVSCYIVQETDGISRFELEDGSGFLLLENCTPIVPPEPGVGGPLRKGRRRRLEVVGGEEDWLAVILSEV